MSLALISSLYRSEKHLPTFAAAVFGFAKQVSQQGIEVRYLPIVNDASAAERETIDRLAREINGNYYGQMTPVYVGRESLYASWNRGINLSGSAYFGAWNADDIRSAAAFIEGYRALQDGATLVDFAFTRVSAHRRYGIFARERRQNASVLFHPVQFARGNGLGPFFLASRELYRRVGAFDENFQVAGDMEWASRAQAHARFYSARQIGGDFLLHGDNLSNSGADREDLEVNIIFMRRRAWDHLRPAHPGAQREAWFSWGDQRGIELPPEIEDFLWGPESLERWQRYRREKSQRGWLRRVRLALAARGLIRSAEWTEFQRTRGVNQ